MRFIFLALTILLSVQSPAFAAEEKVAADVVVNVKGMVCDFCAQGLKRLFGEREEVKDTAIDWESGKVEIEFAKEKTLKDEEIKEIVVGNGLVVESIVRQ